MHETELMCYRVDLFSVSLTLASGQRGGTQIRYILSAPLVSAESYVLMFNPAGLRANVSAQRGDA